MPGIGIGIKATQFRRRGKQPGFAVIGALVSPVSAALQVGQALNATPNWSNFTDPFNYTTSVAGEAIANVTVNFIGDSTSASTPLADGETNHFSVTVTDTQGNERTFPTVARTVVYAAPVAGALAAVEAVQGSGPLLVNLAAGFIGDNLSFSSDQSWATVSGSTLSLADEARTGTVIITATNSGGAAQVDLSVRISPLLVSVSSPIADQSFTQNSGDVTIDLDAVFTNATSYSVTGAGASVAGSTLTLSDDTLRSGVAITVTGSNATNSVDETFTLTVTEILLAPDVTASDSLIGRTLSINVDSLTGTPFPSVSLTTLTLNGQDVLGDQGGNGPWNYIVPSSASAQTIAWTLTATNSEGSDTSGGSEVVTADQFAPAQMSAPSLASGSATQFTIILAVDPDNGGSPITQRDIRWRPTGGSWTTVSDVTSPVEISGVAEFTQHEVQSRVRNSVDIGAWSATALVTTLLTAPVAAGSLTDQSFSENTGVQSYDASGDFTGGGLVYSVNSVSGVSINSSTGVVSFDTDVMGLQSGTSVIVTATNAGGSDSSAFSLDITVFFISSDIATITIPSGRVASDIAGFPVKVDLADIPASMWANMRADAGNLRATNAADDTTYPLDVVWTDTKSRTGTAFVRQDLLAASDVEFTLRLRSAGTRAAAVTAPEGRNAVWGDHLAVIAFPDKIDRTGNHSVTEDGNLAFGALSDTQLSPDIQMHQGVAWDGTHWYVTDTDQIKKYDTAWNILATNNTPNADTGIPAVNHLGDPCIIGGELFIPIEAWPSGPFTNQHICVFNTSDLSFNRSYDISSIGREASSLAFNPADGFIYCTDFLNSSDIPYFDTAGVHQGYLPLSERVTKIQGITFNGDIFYLSSDTQDELFEVALDGTVNPVPLYTSDYGGAFEGLEMKDGVLHVLIDATPSAVYALGPRSNPDTADFDQGYLRVNDIASTAEWTTSMTIDIASIPNNGAAGSLVRKGSENATRATAVIRQTSNPDSYNIWTFGDGYASPSPTIAPLPGDTVRITMGHNGTTERKMLIDGQPYLTDTNSTNKPGGSEMYWVVGGEDSAPSEWIDGSVRFAFLYDGYQSDAHILAEYENLNNPSAFYTVSGGAAGVPISVEEAGDEVIFTLDNSVADAMAVSVTYDGTLYTTDYLGTTITAGRLRAGSICLARPEISGPTGLGDVLTVTPGIWVYPGADPGGQTWQMRRDGVDVAGATDQTFNITAADQGTDLIIEEEYDGLTVSSLAVSIP